MKEACRTGIGSAELLCLLQQCLRNKDCASGGRLHALALVAGFHTVPPIAHLLIRILSSSTDTLIGASSTFCTLPRPSVQSWHAIIAAHSIGGYPSATIFLYHAMIYSGFAPSKPIFLLALKACATIPALIEGLLIHHNVIHEVLDADLFVSSALVYMYAKNSSLDEARALFDTINGKTLVTWNAMLAGYIHSRQAQSAIELFANMEHNPDQVTLSCITKACAMAGSLDKGKHVHQYAVESGLIASQFVASSLVDMYAKCGALQEAQEVFSSVRQRNVVLWNCLISSYVCHGHSHLAVEGLIKMQEEEITPINSTISTVLSACRNLGLREHGRILHALVLEKGILVDEIVVGALVDMYVTCGSLEDAHSVLHVTGCLGKAAWGVMLTGCAQQEKGLLALKIFEEMQCKGIETDSAMYSCVLKAVGLIGALEEGKLVHDQILRHQLESNMIVGSALTDMYNKCGTFDNGFKVYKALTKQDLVSWSTMIGGYVQSGSYIPALELFERLKGENVKPDRVMYSSILSACGGLKAVKQGKCLHDEICRTEFNSDESLQIVLIDMYMKCRHVEEAVSLFEKLAIKGLLAWGAIIVGYLQHGNVSTAFKFFLRMQDSGIAADETILMSLLKTCSSSQELELLHEKIKQSSFESSLGVANSLIDMYGKVGNLIEARKVFDCLLHKDIITWNSMIAGYAEQLSISGLLELYERMQQEGVELDTFTFSCILKACRKVRVMDLGNLIFEQTVRRAFETNPVIISSAIEMYAELGSLEDAQKVFDVSSKWSSSWSAMIGAFAENNHIELATQSLEEMQKQGVKLDDRTRTSIIASMSHCGEWEQAQKPLTLLNKEPGFEPKIEHFNSAVDLLGRSGHVHEAGDLLHALPFPPDFIGLTSLLAAHKSHGKREASRNSF